MKTRIFLLCLILFYGCKNKKDETTPLAPSNIAVGDTAGNFFPVTTFFKGEISELKKNGEVLLRTVSSGKRTDTSWIKNNELDSALASFLSPVIDTANLKRIFRENKFLDRTLNAFTFTYDPIGESAAGFAFRHWDVYVNPDNGKIKRIYLLKKQSDDTYRQLTWQSNKFYKIVTIKNAAGKSESVKEEKISRSYGDE